MNIALLPTVPLTFAFAAALLLFPDAVADPDPPAADEPLDGMVFAGRIGPADDPDLADHLYFENGRFWSGECVRCGFEPGVYWVRRTAGGIAFRGVLESADRGTFTYEGMVRGGRVDVSIHWRHERWYWTIDRNLRFVGEIVEGEAAGMTLEQARALAGGSEPRPDRCPS
jgi:hypothetical protein